MPPEMKQYANFHYIVIISQPIPMKRNSVNFDFKILDEPDVPIKEGMLFHSIASKYFIDLMAYKNVFLMD